MISSEMTRDAGNRGDYVCDNVYGYLFDIVCHIAARYLWATYQRQAAVWDLVLCGCETAHLSPARCGGGFFGAGAGGGEQAGMVSWGCRI
mgnify:CR=1 FL=1